MTDIQRAKESCDIAFKDFMQGKISFEEYQELVGLWELHLERLK